MLQCAFGSLIGLVVGCGVAVITASHCGCFLKYFAVEVHALMYSLLSPTTTATTTE